jgi:tetratricopeptide (TPR) repeat protein
MEPRTFSPGFHQSVKLLVQLHHEMSTGDPDGATADSIRDEMERPWYSMSDQERELVRGLSADLYSIGKSKSVGQEVRIDLVQSAMEALKNGRYENLLQIVRKNERSLPTDSVAFLRGMAWSLLGKHGVAVEFFQEAARISNYQWPTFIHGLLTAQIAAGKAEQAYAIAERIAAESVDPLMLLDAAEVYFVRSTEVDPEQSALIQQRAVDTAKRALELAEQSEQNEALRHQRALIQLWLALSHLSSGDLDAACRAAEAADSLAQDDPNVQFLKEIITQRSDHESWDRGMGKVMVRFGGMPVTISRIAPDLITAN